MAEGKKIMLTISATQYFQEDPKEPPVTEDTQAEALYYKRGDSHYLFYEEVLEGYPEPFRTRLKFRQGYLEMNRKGAYCCRMVFETGKTNRTDYPTPYGVLVMDVVTDSVCLEETEGLFCVTAEYLLKNEGQPIGKYRLRLTNHPM